MRERRALRFLVEALFLGALAVALVFTDLTPVAIAGVMLVGWLVVALYEWAVTRELPHYGRGLPPRWYVPEVALPPGRRLDQLRPAYPSAEVDEPTWIATPAMRDAALAEWRVDTDDDSPLPPPSPGEDTMVVELSIFDEPFHEDTWIELTPAADRAPDVDPVVGGWDIDEVAEVEPFEEPEEVPEPEPVVPEPEPVPELDAAEAPIVEAVIADETELLDAPVAEPEPELVSEPEPEPVALPVAEAPVVEAAPAILEPVVSEPVVSEPVVSEPIASGPAVPEAAAVEPEPAAGEPEPDPEPVVADEPTHDEVIVAAAPDVVPEPDREPEPLLAPAAAAVVAAEVVTHDEPEGESAPGHLREGAAAAVALAGLGALGTDTATVPTPAGAVAATAAITEPDVDEETAEDAVLPDAAPAAPRPESRARHTFDPLGGEESRRRRRRAKDEPYIELPARPPRPLALPSNSRRES